MNEIGIMFKHDKPIPSRSIQLLELSNTSSIPVEDLNECYIIDQNFTINNETA